MITGQPTQQQVQIFFFQALRQSFEKWGTSGTVHGLLAMLTEHLKWVLVQQECLYLHVNQA